MLERLQEGEKVWDFIVIGGGATGVGCAVDAASRGFQVLLLERSDFGKGTSSRSTKLVHGGVRYLANGDLSLVRESLKERGILLKNAPHLVKKLAFVIPCYSLWQKFFYGAGLKFYNLLSGKYGFGKSRILSKKETLEKLPNSERKNLRGGVLYFDGQFDDARLLINLAQTACEHGATLINYAEVYEFLKNTEEKICGVKFKNAETGEVYETFAKCVINATGAFCDEIRQLSDNNSRKIIAPSQGIHLVCDKSFLQSENALMIPQTSDGRVLFAIPWHGKTLIGTTETPLKKAQSEPQAFESEIEFILENVKDYLAKPPRREDITSVFAGIRPLVKSENTKNTASLSRDHTIEIDAANLLTITGGKWTTYRKMAEDAINQAIRSANLPVKKCVTENLKIHGFCETPDNYGNLAIYGSDAREIQDLIEENPYFAEKLHESLIYTKAEIIWAVRNEMAQTIEDVLARRTRILFMDARTAIEIAPKTAKIMAEELGQTTSWQEKQIDQFKQTAEKYLV